MAEHTPTPWVADPDDREGYEWNIHIIDGQDGHNRICFMSNGPETEANAAFIVKAVNSHDALVEALQKIASLEVTKGAAANLAQRVLDAVSSPIPSREGK